MTEQQQSTPPSLPEAIWQRVQEVNALLLKGEPDNITHDDHSDQTGYKPQAVIDAMNAVFFDAWGFKQLSNEFENDGKNGNVAVAHIEVWLDGIAWHPTAYGQGKVTRGDVGDARKSGQTDGIKKGLSYFSIGNRAYNGLLPNPKDVQRQNQGQGQGQHAPQNGYQAGNGNRNGASSATSAPVAVRPPVTLAAPKPAMPVPAAIVPAPAPTSSLPSSVPAVPTLTEKQQKAVALLRELKFGTYETRKFLTWLAVESQQPEHWSDAECDTILPAALKWVEAKPGQGRAMKGTEEQIAEFGALTKFFRQKYPQYPANADPKNSVMIEIRNLLRPFKGEDGAMIGVSKGATIHMLDILLAVGRAAQVESEKAGKMTYSIPAEYDMRLVEAEVSQAETPAAPHPALIRVPAA